MDASTRHPATGLGVCGSGARANQRLITRNATARSKLDIHVSAACGCRNIVASTGIDAGAAAPPPRTTGSDAPASCARASMRCALQLTFQQPARVAVKSGTPRCSKKLAEPLDFYCEVILRRIRFLASGQAF